MSDAEPILRLGKNVQRMNISTGTTGKSVEKSLGIRNDQVSNDAAAYSKNMLMDEQKKLFQVIAVGVPRVLAADLWYIFNYRHLWQLNRPTRN